RPGRPAPATPPRPEAPSALRGALTPDGAIADGASHPLSARFPDLAAARASFPHASAMTDELDWCALQGAINRADAQGGGAVQVPNGGRGYVLNRTLVVNPNKVTMRGDGSLLDFRSLPAGGRAVWFKADGAPPYGHEKHVFEGFDLLGPGREQPDCIGVFCQTDTPPLSSRVQLRDCVVRSFRVGVELGHRAYLVSFSHCSFYDSTFVFRAPAGLEDAGESITFNQCALFNSYCLIANMAGCGLRFMGCSLDYASRIVWDNNGHIDFVSCHIEFAPPEEVPFHNGVGRVDFHGGFLQINGDGEPRVAGLFASNVADATYHMFGLRGWNWGTTTGKLAVGPGKIYWHAGAEIDAPPAGYGRR
ncbi:hypothetical protein, partial [Plastoroseomonas arctica]|nr:hypothetical protein [Plastoroseomonas arctica]